MAVFRKEKEQEQVSQGTDSILLSILNAITSGVGGGATEATLELARECICAVEANTDSLLLKTKLLQVDTVGTTTYLGYANPGTLTSAALWAVKKVVETGGDAVFTWADGDKEFDNIWDDRLSLTYS